MLKKVNFETPITNKSVEIKPVLYVAYIFENYKVFTEQTIFSNKLLKQRNNKLIKWTLLLTDRSVRKWNEKSSYPTLS